MSADIPLSDLRKQIDEIDDTMHDLIMRRAEVVKKVRALKESEGYTIKIRPGREAEIIYRLFANHSGPFPKRELFRMWREMIVATLSMEGPFSVAVLMNGQDCGYWDMARDQYGSFIPMTPMDSMRHIVESVRDQKSTVGIVPVPTSREESPWWPRLMSNDTDSPRVIARLPFVGAGNGRCQGLQALVLCPVPQEETGRDRSYLAFEANQSIAPSRFKEKLKEAGLTPVFFTSHDSNAPQHWLYLVELDGYVNAGDAGVQAVVKALKLDRVVGLGGYALPFTDDELSSPEEELSE